MTAQPSPSRRVRRWVASLTVAALALAGPTGCASVESALTGASTSTTSVWDASSVHEVALTVDEDEFAAMVATYADSGEKEWVSADVTIDGQTFSNVGIRLKGNSSLRGVDADADPADLPWLIDLDKYVDGQSLDGWERFVVRSNNSETALNEAVALDLLEEAGLTTQESVATSFTVNGSDARLRLVMQDLDDRWTEATFDGEGTLYKSEAGGDWSYRGDEATAYEDVFDIEGGTEDYAPLTQFLQWLEESSDEEFADGLADRLDVEAFATYLAFEDLVGNFDDIDGPGNNSFLRWDADTGLMTVVAWDHNLAFGGFGGMGGERGPGGPGGTEDGERPEVPEGFEPPTDGEMPDMPEGFEPPTDGEMPDMPEGFEPPTDGEMPDMPEGFEPPTDGEMPDMPEGFEPPTDGEMPDMPEGFEPPTDGEMPDMPEGFEPPTDGEMPGGGMRGGPGGSNVLVERFQDNEEFAALYDEAVERLQAELYDDGTAQGILDDWTTLLTEQAGDLVDEATVAEEADQVASYFDGHGATEDQSTGDDA
ncbi:CotH kinase family protein [Nocardioides panacisoli]|uniref:CotH kinase family protein n=1 Tax=Nocardioides panacisoli TaxID=627624 RepID=UPI001C63A566|nr:CotH kinase family protein [Nocardioides panacisoli]QYJ03348.1 CotH kinase family protein [Nocardioides panacisoli]